MFMLMDGIGGEGVIIENREVSQGGVFVPEKPLCTGNCPGGKNCRKIVGYLKNHTDTALVKPLKFVSPIKINTGL
jgi:hypothetical protein